MRDSVFFEVRLRRFGVWQVAVWLVGGAAVVATAVWADAIWDSQPEVGRLLAVALAGALSLATIGLALSLSRVQAGVLSCADGIWSFASDAGVRRTGSIEVAMDLGVVLLLRLVDQRRTLVWLPVQRRGLESEWHGLRCAVYSPRPHAAGLPTAPAPTE